MPECRSWLRLNLLVGLRGLLICGLRRATTAPNRVAATSAETLRICRQIAYERQCAAPRILFYQTSKRRLATYRNVRIGIADCVTRSAATLARRSASPALEFLGQKLDSKERGSNSKPVAATDSWRPVVYPDLMLHVPASRAARLRCWTTRRLSSLPPLALVLARLGARRHDVDHRHVTKVSIVGIVEPVLSDKSLKVVDVGLPAL